LSVDAIELPWLVRLAVMLTEVPGIPPPELSAIVEGLVTTVMTPFAPVIGNAVPSGAEAAAMFVSVFDPFDALAEIVKAH